MYWRPSHGYISSSVFGTEPTTFGANYSTSTVLEIVLALALALLPLLESSQAVNSYTIDKIGDSVCTDKNNNMIHSNCYYDPKYVFGPLRLTKMALPRTLSNYERSWKHVQTVKSKRCQAHRSCWMELQWRLKGWMHSNNTEFLHLSFLMLDLGRFRGWLYSKKRANAKYLSFVMEVLRRFKSWTHSKISEMLIHLWWWMEVLCRLKRWTHSHINEIQITCLMFDRSPMQVRRLNACTCFKMLDTSHVWWKPYAGSNAECIRKSMNS
jgi:hypothetical protein